MFFSVHTLGCKLNQLETEAITDAFSRNGFTPFSDGSGGNGIVIVNTCTVTSMAEQKARRLIRKLLKDHPAACIIITGCYAQLDKEIIEREFPERVIVIPGENKDLLLDLPVFLTAATAKPGLVMTNSLLYDMISSFFSSSSAPSVSQRLYESSFQVIPDPSFRFRPEKFASHSRGFMKIQDGCDRRCSYCRVSLARGKSRSLGAEEVLNELLALEKRGFNEAVLTGVNITQYRDVDMDLAGLLEFLLDGTDKIRLRLSSIDPDMLNEKFFDVLANERIRPHFHLSLQSLNAHILAKMGRAYTTAEIEKTVEKLRLVKDDPFLACDIITAFPGETASEAEETRMLCEKIGFAWIHAFPFSPRPGTAAFDFPGRVNDREAKSRVEALTSLAKKGRQEYLGRWKGREVEAVIEAGKIRGGSKQMINGVSENYLKLLINPDYNSSVPVPGSLVKCRITGITPKDSRFDAFGEIITGI